MHVAVIIIADDLLECIRRRSLQHYVSMAKSSAKAVSYLVRTLTSRLRHILVFDKGYGIVGRFLDPWLTAKYGLVSVIFPQHELQSQHDCFLF